MNEPVKFCINCKHFKKETSGLSTCVRPTGISLVYGTPTFRNSSAAAERTLDHTGCGEKAKYFELKVEA